MNKLDPARMKAMLETLSELWQNFPERNLLEVINLIVQINDPHAWLATVKDDAFYGWCQSYLRRLRASSASL